MDNGFLTILFYIFIIVIFLSSLFKKKPKGTQEKRQTDLPDGSSVRAGTDTGRPNYNSEKADDNKEILAELENLFKNGNQSAPVQENQNSNVPAAKKTKIESYSKGTQTKVEPEENFDYDKWPGSEAAVTMENIIVEREKPQPPQVNLDSKIEKEARDFEKLLNPRQEENKLVGSVREKIKNPETLKEYIVFNEIIGKPKSLRR